MMRFVVNIDMYHRTDPWFCEWKDLSPTGRNVKQQEAVILVKGLIAAGYFLKPMDSRTNK